VGTQGIGWHTCDTPTLAKSTAKSDQQQTDSQPSGRLRFFPDLAHFPHTNEPQRTRVGIAERQNEFAFIAVGDRISGG
jgi:hypothetical protein